MGFEESLMKNGYCYIKVSILGGIGRHMRFKLARPWDMRVQVPQDVFKGEMKMGFIYVIRNDVNNKLYIGQTTYNLDRRWQQHLSKSKTNNSLLYKR